MCSTYLENDNFGQMYFCMLNRALIRESAKLFYSRRTLNIDVSTCNDSYSDVFCISFCGMKKFSCSYKPELRIKWRGSLEIEVGINRVPEIGGWWNKVVNLNIYFYLKCVPNKKYVMSADRVDDLDIAGERSAPPKYQIITIFHDEVPHLSLKIFL